MEGESGVTRSVLDQLHSLDIQQDETEGGTVLLEVSMMNFILLISNEM